MVSLLLSIIYIAFISLGLPDSLLGSAWPVMSADFGVSISYAGIVSMIISGSTILSSLLSNRVTHKFGPGTVTAVSVCLTAFALLGMSFAPSFIVICVFAVPYGLGAGGVDAALNNYVAIHFKARHMSWLHCFWGIGASVSPYIMGYFLTTSAGWKGGYCAVAAIQIILSIVLCLSLPLWKKVNYLETSSLRAGKDKTKVVSILDALKISGVPFVLLTFFGYCALETTAGLWASSYLVNFRGIDVNTAARFASLFYLGITVGRFLTGFIAEAAGDKRLIRSGIIVITAGIIMIMIPSETDTISLIGLIVVGFGCAPVYPSIIHSTPFNFGAENSQSIVGIQMASAYIGSTFMPPLFGAIASGISIKLYPFFLMFFVLVMIFGSEILNVKVRKNRRYI